MFTDLVTSSYFCLAKTIPNSAKVSKIMAQVGAWKTAASGSISLISYGILKFFPLLLE